MFAEDGSQCMLGFLNRRDEVHVLDFVVNCLDVLETNIPGGWCPISLLFGWNSGAISLTSSLTLSLSRSSVDMYTYGPTF